MMKAHAKLPTDGLFMFVYFRVTSPDSTVAIVLGRSESDSLLQLRVY